MRISGAPDNFEHQAIKMVSRLTASVARPNETFPTLPVINRLVSQIQDGNFHANVRTTA